MINRSAAEKIAEVYDFMNYPERFVVKYPDSGHDFPEETRLEAFRFIDKYLKQ